MGKNKLTGIFIYKSPKDNILRLKYKNSDETHRFKSKRRDLDSNLFQK